MEHDPITTDPALYALLFENDRVRVLEYRDKPGEKTAVHQHPDSVVITLSAFSRRLTIGAEVVEFDTPANEAAWRPAQMHSGENIGTTDSHVIFVELK